MRSQPPRQLRYSSLAIPVAICLAVLGMVRPALADLGVFQTIPTRTPAYTLPPGPTSTSVPAPSNTPHPPGGTATPSPGATTTPGITPPSSFTALPGTSTLAVPSTPKATPVPAQSTPATVLECVAKISAQDVLPGQQVEYALVVTNAGAGPAQSVALQDSLGPGLDLLRIRSTQGAVEVNADVVILRLGIIEAGQSALAILDLRVSLASQPGQVFVQQADIFSDEGQAVCNPVAGGTRPDHLPNTGADRRVP